MLAASLNAFFLHLSDLLLRSKLHAFAGRKVLLRRDTLGEAVNGRNENKKTFKFS